MPHSKALRINGVDKVNKSTMPSLIPLRHPLRVVIVGCIAGTAALVAAQNSPAKATHSSKPDILVGAISSLSGPVAFPESTDAARAYFNAVNANGGIQGRALKLMVEDDKGNPVAAQAAAKKLLKNDALVAMVGSASIVECGANAKTYEAEDIVSIQGTGVEPACFESARISPVNTGPYLAAYTALEFATKVLKSKNPCVMVLNLGNVPAFEKVLAQWTKQTARQQLPLSMVFNPGDDHGPLQKQVIEKKCDAIVYTGVEPMVLDWVEKGRKIPGFMAIPHLFLTPAYTQSVAQKLGAVNEPIYAMSEFEPWSSRSGSLSDWAAVMVSAKVPLSSFSQGGYSSAQIFVRILRSIKGDITRKSVTEALRQMQPMDVPMIGTPYLLGTGTQHNPNHATLPVKLIDGKWRVGHHAWVIVEQ